MRQQKQITQTLYFVKWPEEYEITLSNIDSTLNGARVVLGSAEVTVDIPGDLRDPIEAQIESLAAERTRLQAEAGAQVQNIDEQIQKLQAISYAPEES